MVTALQRSRHIAIDHEAPLHLVKNAILVPLMLSLRRNFGTPFESPSVQSGPSGGLDSHPSVSHQFAATSYDSDHAASLENLTSTTR